MDKNYKYTFATKEDKQFNVFLNKTIKGASYNFFNSWKDDAQYTEEYNDDIAVDCPCEKGLFEDTKDIELGIALESLTDDERLVISFFFEEKFKGEEIAEMLNIIPNSLYRKKKKILNKLKNRIIEERKNGRY